MEEDSALSMPENFACIKREDSKYSTTMAYMFLVPNWLSRRMLD